MINPSKTDLVVFTQRGDTSNLTIPILFGTSIRRSYSVKHLGVILDCKLSWIEHLVMKLQKVSSIFWQCIEELLVNLGVYRPKCCFLFIRLLFYPY